ncbi:MULTISPECIES: response regulator transcription factor [Thiomicrorhabdus]|uniref:Response regulator transcription factor n=1 Tax=Thiomicrorhabdus heinhorstiae TaxID=2748010 RepID=A0ABS0BUY3_9GAMM|nr:MULTISPECIES: response regulator transcription factor [Thiomicrorhabdus]MBF6057641.1 response regulator transcription factor [Thiomicrorhabdus heinhorstiae]
MNNALILEDNPEAMLWMRQRFQQVFPNMSVEEVISVAQAKHALSQSTFELALIDLHLPDGSGIEILREISRFHSNTLSIVVSIYDDDAHLFPALQSGAKGYLLKDMPSEQFEERLKMITYGEPALSPAIARKILKYFGQTPLVPSHDLTQRELEVLTLIAKGLTAQEAADMLKISSHTAKDYIKTIYRKLDISTRSEASLEAVRLGLVQP